MRTMDDVLCQQLDLFRARSGKTALRILEVGCARSTNEGHQVGDGWSSLTLARQVRQHGGQVTGIDLDVSQAVRLLAAHGLVEDFVEGDSLTVMSAMIRDGFVFDVVFLDSGNDPDLVLNEFLLAQKLIDRPGLLMADDMDQNDPEVVKGLRLVPYLRKNGYSYRMTHRETPWTNRDVLVMDIQ